MRKKYVYEPRRTPFGSPRNLRGWWAWCGVVVLTVVPLWRPATCSGSLLSDEWSHFDRALSIFDPAGTYVSQPIEKAIPALSFKGFFRQWSDINLHRNQKVGFRNKDFRFLQLQNLLEIELHYQFTDNLELTSINHFLYDGVYNWQDAGGLFAPRVSETARHYHNFERVESAAGGLRGAAVSLYPGSAARECDGVPVSWFPRAALRRDQDQTGRVLQVFPLYHRAADLHHL